MSLLLEILSALVGLAMFAYFTDVGCDPLKGGYISNPNQVKLNHSFKETLNNVFST